MKTSKVVLVLLLFSLLLAFVPVAKAQTVTGSVVGSVADSGGAIVVGAKVTITNAISKQTREFASNSSGDFEFTSLIPGAYSLKIVHPGIQRLRTTEPDNQFTGTR